LVLAGLLLLEARSVSAQTPLRILVDDANPPFMYQNGGRAAGLYPRLVAAGFRHMGMPVEIQAVPWRRALHDADTAGAGVAGIYKNSERLAKYDYSEPLFVERVNIYAADGRQAGSSAGLASLHGQRVGAIRGWSYGDDFDKARQEQRFVVEEVTSDEQNFRKLDAGRLDVALAIEDAARLLLAAHPKVLATGRLTENPTYLAFSKRDARTAVLRRFNEALKALRADGRYDAIARAALTVAE
jgi:polar amino acid transport system substrate-binding protein